MWQKKITAKKSHVQLAYHDTLVCMQLPFSYTWQMMKETFKAAGEVQYAEIKKDNDNKSRGFGVVRYATPDEARRAVSIL